MKLYCSFLILIFTVGAFANGHYPELLVAPRASERLHSEMAHESKWFNYMPLQAAAATTLAAGLVTMGDYDKEEDSAGVGPKIAVAVGASWLAASIYMQNRFRPYARAHHVVKRMPYQNSRDQLVAERIAEEHIDYQARFARKIKWLAFGSNLASSAYAFSSAEKDSAGQGIAGLAILASTLPLLFPLRAEQVGQDQHMYKKKVFGPISFGNGMLINPVNLKPTLGFLVATQF